MAGRYWQNVKDRLHAQLRRFGRAREGNVAITFGFALLPLIGIVGTAVDYSHGTSVKVALQAALDSTALMIARDATTLSNADLNTKAMAYFKGLMNRPEVTNYQLTANYTSTGGSAVVLNGSVDVSTTFMAAIGVSKFTVNGSSTAKWGSTRLRVALALDNTGSMADDGKMTALKSATKNLLSQLKGAATTNGDVYVSIVPFAKDVNVGSSNYNASWIDWSDWDSNNKTCSGWQIGNFCWGTQSTASHSTWNGCVTDRGPSSAPGSAAGYDQKVDLPVASNTSTLFLAEQYDSCPAAMLGLTYDWTGLNSLVDSMQPNGGTNQPIGLVWAWQSLVGGGPLSAPAKSSNYQYQEIIILMSDGLNTQNRWSGNGSQQSTAVDNRMYNSGNGNGTCANIKASGVTIYTIHVNTGGDPTSTLLQNCASTSDKFWMITSAADLNGVFSAIGTNITRLRVAN